MKVVMLSKALVSGAYQKKLEELASFRNITLVALVPPFWREPRVGITKLERMFTRGYRLEILPMVANGQHHLHFYPGLHRVLQREKPDVFHIDEESFNLATFLAMRSGVGLGARCCFYNWANIERRYPPPFAWFERYNFRHAAHAIAGNQEAADILRRHGYAGPIALLPQFGVDPLLFSPPGGPQAEDGLPAAETETDQRPFIVGYLGRLIEAKGILDLVEALAELPGRVRLRLVGSGQLRPRIEQRAQELNVAARVEILPTVGSTDVPGVLRRLDVLALPSHTTANWKEQFGRVIIEAMSCGVPVVGSSSGEIPNVIGDAGLVVPEQNIAALRDALLRLLHDVTLRQDLARRGRERILENYTHLALASKYYNVYREMLGLALVPYETLMKNRKVRPESYGLRHRGSD